jgi:hypothetical protein
MGLQLLIKLQHHAVQLAVREFGRAQLLQPTKDVGNAFTLPRRGGLRRRGNR